MAKTGQIGLDNLHIALRENDENIKADSTLKIAGLVTADVEIDMYSESLYADDVVADVVNGFSEGTVTVELLGLSLDEYAKITGQEIVKGVVVDNVNVVAPELAMTFRSLKSNGKYRYVSIPKLKANVKGESFKTREDGVEVVNAEIEFNIIPLENGTWRVRADEDGKDVDAAFIKSFLTSFPQSATTVSSLSKASKKEVVA